LRFGLLLLGTVFLFTTACQPVNNSLPSAAMQDSGIKPENPNPIAGNYVQSYPFSLVVTNIQQKNKITLRGRNYEPETKYLMVTFNVSNLGTEPIIIEPTMFRLVDDQGNKYKPNVAYDLLLNGNGKGFFHQPLKSREKKGATLLFDTPVGIGQGYLEIKSPMSPKTAFVRLVQ
jgi:hypothetical protein